MLRARTCQRAANTFYAAFLFFDDVSHGEEDDHRQDRDRDDICRIHDETSPLLRNAEEFIFPKVATHCSQSSDGFNSARFTQSEQKLLISDAVHTVHQSWSGSSSRSGQSPPP